MKNLREVTGMKQLIVTLGLVLLGLRIFGMMITDENSLYKAASNAISSQKEAYVCTN